MEKLRARFNSVNRDTRRDMFNYLLVIVAFVVMGLDKWKARHHAWRIPERTLWFLALFFGAPGACVGMIVFHHKTRKPAFFIGFPLLAIIEIWICAIMLR